ncbi:MULTISPECIES: insulinase family protein [Aliivibrio]|uniref:Protease 3 n=1 Tax=Aliivibrio finisterrensis TaxID=511998 RepID=A0A4Q5KS22_9GAMM|nr:MULTISPECIES: insulinase family protein [Aliivibrio]MDD9179404.1 insulinase family protein [Aliivibrio sp. A6]RYU49968.1 insulinase family protein [Aliivibrio finisterrensis]RYU50615.1 insulinase family protein [Aliivibrio finisterrensis]RYU56676.1 insulinase family protein [Aliivibrio finisterrensis]RYU62697.1 insulinase family protein [Aliivibrio finisterrensis]
MHISPNDQKKYRFIELDNKLRVLLVQDDTAPRSSAALSVNVGHFDDPDHRPGLAHFLEHMLFLGTEKYPKVGEFHSFINQQGGSNNAWTGTEHTTFFFEISHHAFEEGLDRFGQFFYASLFNEEAVDKERQAVDSEYKLKLKDDVRRIYQVHKETINQAHPFAKFSVGSIDTLADNDTSSIRDEMLAFYQDHYSADLMTAVVLGNRPLCELELLATQSFSAIPNQNLGHKTIDVAYVTEDQQACWINIEPLKEVRKLTLAFSLPNQDRFYKTKPLNYLGHLLGYEGEGSLMLYLKKLGYIHSLTAGGGVSGSNFREFTLAYNLTEKGIEHTDEIITLTYQYIELIKQQGFDEWRYSEKKAVLESAFQFQEKSKPLDLVSHLVMNLQRYHAEDAMYADYMMEGYHEQQIKDLLEQLTPEKMRVTLVAQGLEYDHKDKWYHTPYSVHPLTENQLALWKNVEPHPELFLPEKNPYICYDLEPQALTDTTEFPMLIEDLPGFRLWHKQEEEFRVPKGMVYIAIDSPHSISDPRKIVKTRLCVEMLMDALSEQTYQAEIAGMGYNLYCHQGGVTLALSGFSQKQPLLLEVILKRFTTREFSSERFDFIKNQLIRHWSNASKERPISQLFNALSGILQPNNPPYPVLLEALESIEVDDLPNFVQAMFAELHVEMFVYGDWSQQQALDLGSSLKNALRMQNQTYEESFRPLIMLGESGTFQRELFCDHSDSALLVYYQSAQEDPRSFALYTLANHLMSASFFHEIRTKQQLGYMVGTGNLPLNKHPGLILYVQSPMAPPAILLDAIDEFLNAFYMVLLELNEEQWQNSKQGLIDQISDPDTNLRGRAQRLWACIGNKDLNFDHKERVADELSLLTRTEMLRFVVNVLKPRTANRLIMHCQGTEHEQYDRLDVGLEIDSIDEFQLRAKDVNLG